MQPMSPEMGAAYQILFERLAPDNIQNQGHFDAVKQQIEDILIWAATQTSEVNSGYRQAAKLILENTERNLTRINLQNRVAEKYKSIPRPPS